MFKAHPLLRLPTFASVLATQQRLTDAAEQLRLAAKDRPQQAQLWLALDEIELDRRAVFVLHELDGFTCEAIAQSLEIPLGTVYSRLRLARQDFSAKMRRLKAKRVLE